ncbi:hypothetical protein [Fodinicola feengrottensis]|uniref:hypothetical protein n=1 Tax=Fodinicola feengrottensis TaxID=435914 RepID=UPI0031D5E90C
MSDRTKGTRHADRDSAAQQAASRSQSQSRLPGWAESVLALQRSAGNAAVSGLMVQRQHLDTKSGHSVGDATGPMDNTREDVLAVLAQLNVLQTMSKGDFAAQQALASAAPKGTKLSAGDLAPTIAAIAANEKPYVSASVAQKVLHAKVSADVGTGGANKKTDVTAVVEAMHHAGHLSNDDYATALQELSAATGATVAESSMPTVLKGLAHARWQAAIMTTPQTLDPIVATSDAGAVGTAGERGTSTAAVGSAPKGKSQDAFDAKARQLGAKDYQDYGQNMLVSGGSVAGRSVDSSAPVHPLFLTKLEQASAHAKELLGDQDFGIKSVGGFRPYQGPHAWGLAVDLDVIENPYVAGESGEKALDAVTGVVYQRIASTLLGRDSVVAKGLGGAKYQAIAEESDAMVAYFSVLGGGPKRDVMSHHGAFDPAVLAGLDRTQVKSDYDTLIGAGVPAGGLRGDFPFRPNSMGGGKISDPKGGFLTIREEIVTAFRAAGFRWGGSDFGADSGDIQHFDESTRSGAVKQEYFDYGSQHASGS